MTERTSCWILVGLILCSHSFQIQVIKRDYQPSEHVTAPVALLALSLDGSVMSTVEDKFAEEGVGDLFCLKFWDRGSEQKDFSFSTILYEPHRDAALSAVAFHPTRAMVVSLSYGGNFKVWVHSQEIESKDQKLQNNCWTVMLLDHIRKSQ